MISTVSLLNELLSMPVTLRWQVLCFTILHLFTTESPTRLCFFLNKPWNCLRIVYRNVERYLFPAESSLTLNLWNEAIFFLSLILKPFLFLRVLPIWRISLVTLATWSLSFWLSYILWVLKKLCEKIFCWQPFTFPFRHERFCILRNR